MFVCLVGRCIGATFGEAFSVDCFRMMVELKGASIIALGMPEVGAGMISVD
jgi:hypothetical protein